MTRQGMVWRAEDAGHVAWRVLIEVGPLRDCPWCGLFASPEAAAAHATKHGVRVVAVPEAASTHGR